MGKDLLNPHRVRGLGADGQVTAWFAGRKHSALLEGERKPRHAQKNPAALTHEQHVNTYINSFPQCRRSVYVASLCPCVNG